MSNPKTKLELTRVGKHTDFQLEPRILIEKPELSNNPSGSENILIHGDNLLALKALEQEFSGQVKCIYIDPPYNIEVANPHYKDGYEHSEWLTLMYQRLLLLRNLLTDDGGAIFVQIDDGEYAYLKILMDEVFGRENFVNSIVVKMSEASGVKMSHVKKRLPKLKEYLLLYKKDKVLDLEIDKVQLEGRNEEYKIYLDGFTKEDKATIDSLLEKEENDQSDAELSDEIFSKVKLIGVSEKLKSLGISDKDSLTWKLENAWRIVQFVGSGSVKKYAEISLKSKNYNQSIGSVISPKGLLYFFKVNFDSESKSPRVQMVFADNNLFQHPGDLWLDIKTTGGVGAEGGVLFPNSKKPEKLLQKIVNAVTQPGDLVLDSFLGSGTTAAVAHKMGRRWIGIELGDHAYTHAKVRMDKVIEGEQGGISKLVEWKGGGGYKFYELGPSVLIKDQYDNYIINPEFDSNMLIQSLCKIENFTYKAYIDTTKHGYSTEKDFIHVTTRHITQEIINDIVNDTLKNGETLLIVAKTFAHDLTLPDTIQIKKIPPEILGKCSYDKSDYNLPVTAQEIDDQDTEDLE